MQVLWMDTPDLILLWKCTIIGGLLTQSSFFLKLGFAGRCENTLSFTVLGFNTGSIHAAFISKKVTQNLPFFSQPMPA